MSPDAAFSHDSCVSAAPSLWRRGAHSPLSHLGFVLEHRLALKVVVPMHDLGAQHAQVARTFEISSMSAVANDVPVTPHSPTRAPPERRTRSPGAPCAGVAPIGADHAQIGALKVDVATAPARVVGLGQTPARGLRRGHHQVNRPS